MIQIKEMMVGFLFGYVHIRVQAEYIMTCYFMRMFTNIPILVVLEVVNKKSKKNEVIG